MTDEDVLTIDTGSGPPLVLVPGIQGRWEWMLPLIGQLAAHHRVLSFSLNDVPRDAALRRWTAHIDRLLDNAGERTAALVGTSFGGLIAACYAARRPQRTSHLVLVSAPPPTWQLDPQSARYVRHPRLALPFFALRATRRFVPEVAAALPAWPSRAAFVVRQAARACRWPVSPPHMAAWVQQWMADARSIETELRTITAPTLLITGERHLDRIVPVQSSLEYLQLIDGATHVTLDGTGHLGLLSKPDALATLIRAFILRADNISGQPAAVHAGKER